MWKQGFTKSFITECFSAVHNLDTNTMKWALYGEDAQLNCDEVTEYTSAGEISAVDYNAGGFIVAWEQSSFNTDPPYVGLTSWIQTANLTVTGIRGMLIYNASKANRSVAVFDFGRLVDLSNQGLRFTDVNAKLLQVRG